MTTLTSKHPYPIIRARRDGTLVSTNPAAKLLVKGWKWRLGEICPEKSLQRQIRAAYNSENSLEIEISIKNSVYVFTLLPVPGEELVDLYGYDLTRRKKAELAVELNQTRLESLFHILQFKALNPQILLDYTLDEAIKLTKSKLGYIYFYNVEKREFIINSWSRSAMEACSITEPQTIYSLEKTGFWGEVIRQEQPVILNDFHAPNPLKKGYPENHAHLDKFMSIPVYQGEVIVAVVGVANKETDYDETDIHQLEWLMSAVWKIVGERKAEEALKLQVKELCQKNEELAHLHALAERQVRQLASLHAIDSAMVISDESSHHMGLEILLEQALQQLQIHAAAILRSGPNAQTFEYCVYKGFHLPPPRQIQLDMLEGCAWLATQERRPVIIPNLADEPEALPELVRLSRENFVTYICIPLISRGQIHGLLELYHREIFELDAEGLDYAERLASQAAIAMDGAAAFERLQRANLDLTLAYDSTLEGWAHAVEVHEHEVDGHTRCMASLTIQIANSLGVGKDELMHIYRGVLLHDIGIISIPDEILHKSSPLNAEEWEIIRKHPQVAYEILAPIPFLKHALDIPYCHHEKWDGSGYPRGLKGDAIPLAARIFAIVDCWDALIARRAQRKAFSHAEALEFILEQAGKHFDPEIVEVFQKLATNGLGKDNPGPTQLFLL